MGKNKVSFDKDFKSKLIIYIVFLIFFISAGINSLLNKEAWFMDTIYGIIVISIVLYFSKWFKLSISGFFFGCIAMFFHILGAYGFYNWSYGIVHYDNIVHLVASSIVAYLSFNFMVEHFGIKLIKAKKFIFLWLIFSLVLTFGTLIEIGEFISGTYLGEGEGLFYTGAGDISEKEGLYEDTLIDMIVNFFGTIFGMIFYYFFKFKKKLKSI